MRSSPKTDAAESAVSNATAAGGRAVSVRRAGATTGEGARVHRGGGDTVLLLRVRCRRGCTVDAMK